MDELREIRARLSTPGSAQVRLDDTEKAQLRALSRPGGPLYKILQGSLDYAAEMKEIIASAPLDTPEGVELARQLQRKRNATLDYVRWFVEQYDDPASRKQQKDTSRG